MNEVNYNFLQYLEAQVNKSIYVWGAQGKNLSEMGQEQAEAWIRSREYSREASEASNVANAERCIALFRRRLEQGIDPVLAFDCSGLIMYFLQNLTGEYDHDLGAVMLYAHCDYHPALNELRVGDLVFKGKTPSKINHVGVYVGEGKIIECRGRDVGVIKSDLTSDVEWKFAGHLPALDKYLYTDTGEHPVYTVITSPMQKGEAYREMQEKLNKDGFTDDNGNALVCDGKWGAKSLAAFLKFINYQKERQ